MLAPKQLSDALCRLFELHNKGFSDKREHEHYAVMLSPKSHLVTGQICAWAEST